MIRYAMITLRVDLNDIDGVEDYDNAQLQDAASDIAEGLADVAAQYDGPALVQDVKVVTL